MFVSNYVLVGPSGNHSANPEFEHARSRYLSNRPVHVCVCMCIQTVAPTAAETFGPCVRILILPGLDGLHFRVESSSSGLHMF